MRPLDEPSNKTLREGLMAYSEKQIAMECVIAEAWLAKWRIVRTCAAPIIAGNTLDDLEEENFTGEVETIELVVNDDENGYKSGLD